MLKLIENGVATVIGQDDYCIDEKDTGLDLLTFSLPRGHPFFGRIREETEIDEEQPYIVKQVTSDEQNMDVTCELNVDDWKADILEHVILHDNTMHQMIEFCLPSEWTYQDETTGNDGVDELLNDGGTRLEILTATKDIWNITFRFDARNKVLHIIDPTAGNPCGAYLARELNLRSVNYTGSTDKFCTRLYCYGKGGMTFEDINDGKAYIENHTYSSKIVSARYSNADANTSEKLLEAGQKELAKRCCPQASYECDVIDLAKALDVEDDSKYDFMKFGLFSIITLLDIDHHTRINHRIAEYKRYPNFPQKNSVTLSTVPAQIQDDIHKAQSNADEAQITAGDAKSTADAAHVEVTKLSDEMEQKVSKDDFSTLLRQSSTDVLMAFNSAMGSSGIDFSATGIDFTYDGSQFGKISTQSYGGNGTIGVSATGTMGGINLTTDYASLLLGAPSMESHGMYARITGGLLAIGNLIVSSDGGSPDGTITCGSLHADTVIADSISASDGITQPINFFGAGANGKTRQINVINGFIASVTDI